MTDLPKIPLAGVIGHPIAHSRSPALHGFWLRRYGINGHYIPMDVSPVDLEETLRLLPRIGFVGLNVTIPHKEAILKIADVITDRAALIKSTFRMIDEGTEPEAGNFSEFVPVLDASGHVTALRFVFPPYQVGPYADGTQTVDVPAALLLPHVAPAYAELFAR